MNKNMNSPRGARLLPARVVEVPTEHEGRRLDKFLRAQFRGVPATLLFRHLRKGKVRVNEGRVQPGYRLQSGDRIQLPTMRLPDAIPPPKVPADLLHLIERGIVHEDADLLVIDKPADVAVHVGTGVSAGVIEALRQLRPAHPDLELVHRLDRDTSGLLMVAKTHSMLRHLQQALREDAAVDRRYVALVRGAWPARVTEVHAPLRRPPGSGEGAVTVDGSGQPARTRFSVIRRFRNDATLLQVRLMTGRKHQIRVHTRHAGHPVAGDPKYGDAQFNHRMRDLNAAHMFLHAAELHIPLPSGERLHLTAPTPASWRRPLELLDARAPRTSRATHHRRRHRPSRR